MVAILFVTMETGGQAVFYSVRSTLVWAEKVHKLPCFILKLNDTDQYILTLHINYITMNVYLVIKMFRILHTN